MAKAEKITTITFRRTSNIFVNTGIVAIYEYLDKYQDEDGFPEYDFDFIDNGNALKISSDKLFELLEKLYYFMGQEVYDTITQKQWKAVKEVKGCNLYYDVENDKFKPFPTIFNYGIPSLFTNGRTKNTKFEKNQTKIAVLEKHNPALAEKFKKAFASKEITLKSIIYFNEPYTSIPRLDIINDYFLPGKNICYLTGDSFKKTVSINAISPFIKAQGAKNFKSYCTNAGLNISWLSMYAIRFSPKLFFYSYVKGYDSIICFGYDSNTLDNLYRQYAQYRSMYLTSPEIIACNYMHNFKVTSFKQTSSDEEATQTPNDYVWKSELLFMLIYTIYKRFLISTKWEKELPILVGFRADDFSGTLRPKEFEYFNNFKFVIRIIKYLEEEKINLRSILMSLKIPNDDYQTTRKFRSEILENLLHGKSILPNMAKFYSECYSRALSKKQLGIKEFKQLTNFTIKYENLINTIMDKELQKKAFKLGTSIGWRIIDAEGATQKENAKFGRKYIIHLQKARTLDQFNDAIIRIQNKYQLQVSGDLFREHIDEDNFLQIKQFTIIGALNKLNSILKPIQNKEENEKK